MLQLELMSGRGIAETMNAATGTHVWERYSGDDECCNWNKETMPVKYAMGEATCTIKHQCANILT
jgi:hypothetical protein